MILRIGHIDYTVRPMTDDDDSLGTNWGETDHEAAEILIDTDLPGARQLEVLLHEIVHAAWHEYDMPPHAGEEKVASFVGRAVAAVLRANPHLLPVMLALRDGAGFVGADHG